MDNPRSHTELRIDFNNGKYEVHYCSKWESKDHLLRLYDWDYSSIVKNKLIDEKYERDVKTYESRRPSDPYLSHPGIFPRWKHPEHMLQSVSIPLAAIQKITEIKEVNLSESQSSNIV